jgi:outer membrane protein assembly factor BamB
VEVIPARIAGRVKGIEEGDLLISLRSPNLVAVLDRTSGRIKRAVTGRTIEQHSPHFLPDGRVVVFDNRGGAKSEGGSRVVRIDLETAELQQLFPTSDSTDFLPVSSATAGHIDVSEMGTRILVSFTGQGRVLEIDVQTGTVLWEFNNFHDIAEFLRESAIESDTSIALFHTYGAYYAGQPSFLD